MIMLQNFEYLLARFQYNKHYLSVATKCSFILIIKLSYYRKRYAQNKNKQRRNLLMDFILFKQIWLIYSSYWNGLFTDTVKQLTFLLICPDGMQISPWRTLDVFWTSYVRSVYVLCSGGDLHSVWAEVG